MELRNLNTFVKIAELGSFSAAAQELGYTQSTVTMQIKNLEEELGVQLFDRIGRSIRLTDAGSAALGRAREVLHSASRLREDLAGAGSAQVRVGVYESLCGAFLPGLIQQFARQNPSAGLSVVTASKAELERLLLADQIDLLWIYGREKREHRRGLGAAYRRDGKPSSNMWCIYIMHPKSFVLNFWGAVHSWLYAYFLIAYNTEYIISTCI